MQTMTRRNRLSCFGLGLAGAVGGNKGLALGRPEFQRH